MEEKENESKTYTVQEMEEIIKSRIEQERGRFADYDALKEKAARFDAAQEAEKTELQKAQEKASELQKKIDSMVRDNEIKAARSKVAAETGVPVDLLSGDSEETCKAQAEAIIKFANPDYPKVKDGGDPRKHSKSSTAEQFAEWFEQNMH